LRWQNVDFERDVIHVMNSRRERTKLGRSRSVPLTSIAREELLALHEQTGWSEYVFVNSKTFHPLTDVKKAFTSALRKAGIEDFHFHDLRHYSAFGIGVTLVRRGLVIVVPALSRSLKSWDGQTFAWQCATRTLPETAFAVRCSY
jgi:integrase